MSNDAQTPPPAGPHAEQALQLEPDGELAYRGRIDPTWAQGRTAFGGLSAALLLRAVEATVDDGEVRVRSVSVDFAGPVSADEFRIETRVLRRGRNFVHVAADLLQDGEARAHLFAVLGSSRRTSLSYPPPAPSPTHAVEALRAMPYVEGLMPRFLTHFEMRYAKGFVFTGATEPRVEGYTRHRPRGPLDAPGLLMLLDCWPPTVLPMLKARAPASTVTWTVDFLALPPADTPGDAFFYYEAHAIAANEGCATTEGRMWGPDGTLVCASRQFVAEFSQPADGK